MLVFSPCQATPLAFPLARGLVPRQKICAMVESLALFGLPISEPLTETIEGKDYTVQWFERARFELHPANRPPFNVLAGRLGAEVLAYQGAADPLRGAAWRLASFGLFEAPEAVCPERPATLSFEARRVSGFSGCNNLSGSYRATAETLTFGPPTSTPAACTDEALTRQEREILNRGYEVITRGRPTTVEVIVQPVS